MSEKWFAWYIQMEKDSLWATYKNRFLCPCCFMPTLEEREHYNICLICDWEDDGQDTDDAEVVLGGPNGDYSLEEARRNFRNYATMYRPSDKRAFGCADQKKKERILVYKAFCKSIQSGLDEDWNTAMAYDNRYSERNFKEVIDEE